MTDAIDTIDERFDNTNLETVGGVPYLLMEGFPTGSFEEHSATTVEQYIIQQEHLLDFLVESFGGYVQTPVGLQYAPHRRMPGFDSAMTQRVDFAPFLPGLPSDPFLVAHPNNSSITRGFSKYYSVTITYKAGGESNKKRNNNNNENPDPNDPETFVSVSGDAAGEFVATLGSPLKGSTSSSNGNPGKPWDNPLTLIIPETQWTVTWNFIPDDFFRSRLLKEWRLAMGTVNKEKFNRVLFEAEKETMLFAGFSMTQDFSWRHQVQNVLDGRDLGIPAINVEMKFIEKNVGLVPKDPNKRKPGDPHEIGGHNHAYKAKLGWIRVFQGILDVNQKPLYRLDDHDRLFKPRLNPPDQINQQPDP